MVVQKILKRKSSDVLTIGAEATMEQAAQLMFKHNVGALVVVTDSGRMGILSSRDIVAAVATHHGQLHTAEVGELMRREVVTISPEEDIKNVMRLMTQQRMTHVPVLSSGKLVGIVSIGDVVKHRLEEVEVEANVLRDAYIVSASVATTPP